MKKLARVLGFSALVAVGCGGGSSKNIGNAAVALTGVRATSAEVGKQGKLRVTFDNPVSSGTDVVLSLDQPTVATVPAHLTVPAGALSAETTYDALALGDATITATSGQIVLMTGLSVIDHFTVDGVGVNDQTLEVGASTTLQAFLNGTTPSPVPIAVAAADATIVTVPATVTVPAWASGGEVSLKALAVGTTTLAGTLGSDQSPSVSVRVVDHARLKDASGQLTQLVEVGAKLSLDIETDAIVAMSTPLTVTSSDATVAAAPSNVVIPPGASEADFTLDVVGAGQTQLTVTLADSTTTGTLVAVAQASLSALEVENQLPLAASNAMTVDLDVIAATDHAVTLSSSDPTVLTVPATVTVPKGSSSVSVPLATLKSGTATISATLNGSTLSSIVYVAPTPPAGVYLTLYSTNLLLVGAQAVLYVGENSYNSASAQLTSSDPSVIAVPALINLNDQSQLTVTALKVGKTTITMTANGLSASQDFQVVAKPDLFLSDSRTLDVGQVSDDDVDLSALAPTGTAISFQSSQPAVVAAPATLFLGSSSASQAFGMTGLSSGTSILTVTVDGVSKSMIIYVGSASSTPPLLQSAGINDRTLEVGAATSVFASFYSALTSDTPVAFSFAPSPMPAITVPNPSPVAAVGNQSVSTPVVGANPGAAEIFAAANGLSVSAGLVTVVATPTYSMFLSGNVAPGGTAEGYVMTDCKLAADRIVTLSSSDATVATVAPSSLTLSPTNNTAYFVVTGVANGNATITATPPPLASPGPLTQAISVP